MKKFLMALTALSMIASPAVARDHRYDRHKHDDRTGAVIAGVIGGVVLGVVLSERRSREYRDDRYYRDYNRIPYEEQRLREIERYNRYWTQRQRTCVEVRYIDHYGNVTTRYECR